MEHAHAHANPAVKTSPTFQDWIFIAIVLLILSVVARLGHDAYLEALNTELSKKNGEELVAWLTSTGTERFKKDFKEMPKFIPACNPDDESVMGAVVLEKLIPTPPGSAVPVINSQLIDSDPIDQKLQLRLSVCDKGSYPVKIGEFEF